jgi:dihydrofolate reductase
MAQSDHGGRRPCSSTGLADELRLSIHPVLVGSGHVLFRDGQKQALEFAGAKTFGTGVVVLTYRPAAQPG